MDTGVLDASPILTVREAVADGGRFDGSRTLIWKIPEELWGDEPAYSTLAFSPPMVTDTFSLSNGKGVVSGQNAPVTPAGLVGPPPVPYRSGRRRSDLRTRLWGLQGRSKLQADPLE